MERIDAAGDLLPGLSVILGLIDVRREIIAFVAGTREIGGTLFERIGFHGVPHDPLGGVLGSNVLPGLSAISADMDQSIVAAYPEQIALQRAFCGGEDGAVIFNGSIVLGDGAAAGTLARLIIRRQVWRDALPAGAFIFGHEQCVAGTVEPFRVMRGEEDREVPLKAIFQHIGACPHRIVGPYRNGAVLTGAVVEPGEVSTVIAAVNNVRVQGIGDDVSALASGGFFPVLFGNGAAVSG